MAGFGDIANFFDLNTQSAYHTDKNTILHDARYVFLSV